MDIKGLVRNVMPFTTKAQTERMTQAKTDASQDRDGNGQSQGEARKQKHYDEEEVQEVVKVLEALAGIKDNGLKVRVSANDGVTVIFVEDRQGKVVRRIPESDFHFVLANRTKKSGQLLNKTL